jgi:hypothetical protein
MEIKFLKMISVDGYKILDGKNAIGIVKRSGSKKWVASNTAGTIEVTSNTRKQAAVSLAYKARKAPDGKAEEATVDPIRGCITENYIMNYHGQKVTSRCSPINSITKIYVNGNFLAYLKKSTEAGNTSYAVSNSGDTYPIRDERPKRAIQAYLNRVSRFKDKEIEGITQLA